MRTDTAFFSPPPPQGRLAPSPTGLLHLGNGWAFLLAWLSARSAGGVVILRMEDIDPARSRAHWAEAIMEDLHWLGLDWDYGPDVGGPHAPYTQSLRSACYTAILERLTAAGHCYPCYCTRKELRQLAGAPHVEDMGAPYPGLCRRLTPRQRAAREAAGRKACVRLRCPEAPINFEDVVYGPQRFDLQHCGGDFALRRSDGVVAYQLAVVADDAAMGITQVVRGRDILISTPRQILLYRLLGLPAPQYAHIPLLLDAQGERLAKRHQSLSLRALREKGIAPEAVVGLLAWLARWQPRPEPLAAAALLPHFCLHRIPRDDMRVTQEMLERLHAETNTLRP